MTASFLRNKKLLTCLLTDADFYSYSILQCSSYVLNLNFAFDDPLLGDLSSLNSASLASRIITRCKKGKSNSFFNATVGMVLIALGIPKLTNLCTLLIGSLFQIWPPNQWCMCYHGLSHVLSSFFAPTSTFFFILSIYCSLLIWDKILLLFLPLSIWMDLLNLSS